jgi:NAD(P)H-flavin reductase
LLTCGPDIMMRYVATSALARGLKPTQIWLSLERNMQCAVGFCGHCQLGPAFICKDGPIIRYDRVSSYLDVEGL